MDRCYYGIVLLLLGAGFARDLIAASTKRALPSDESISDKKVQVATSKLSYEDTKYKSYSLQITEKLSVKTRRKGEYILPVRAICAIGEDYAFVHVGSAVKREWCCMLEHAKKQDKPLSYCESNPFRVEQCTAEQLKAYQRYLLFPRSKDYTEKLAPLFVHDNGLTNSSGAELLKLLFQNYFGRSMKAFKINKNDLEGVTGPDTYKEGLFALYCPVTKSLTLARHRFKFAPEGLYKGEPTPSVSLYALQKKQVDDFFGEK